MTQIQNAKTKPPFKWTGGKNRMRDKYRDIFFPDGEMTTFVDMFCGACSISLWVAENFPDTKIILNDKNEELIELYRVFQEEYDDMEKRYQENVDILLSFPEQGKVSASDVCGYLNRDVTEQELSQMFARLEVLKKETKAKEDPDIKEKRKELREIKECLDDYTLPWTWLKNLPKEGTSKKVLDRKNFYYSLRQRYALEPHTQTRAENAGDLLFMMRVNFNGIWKGYEICNGRYSTPPGTMTQKEKFFDVAEIRKFRDFLSKCEVMSKDFGELKEWKEPGTYYYADPPYRDSVVVYDGGFAEEDQLRLVGFLKEMSDAGCWVSESNKEIADSFWDNNFSEENYKKHYMSAKYTAGRGTSLLDVDEVLVTNF